MDTYGDGNKYRDVRSADPAIQTISIHYSFNEPTANQRIADLKAENAELKESLKRRAEDFRTDIKTLMKHNGKLAKHGVKIRKENAELKQRIRDAYEVWAGSEQKIIHDMRDILSDALRIEKEATDAET